MNTDELTKINDEISLLYFKLNFTKNSKKELILKKIKALEEKYKEKLLEEEVREL